MTAVLVQNLSHTFSPLRGGSPIKALSHVSLSVDKGEIFGLLGPNGGGKTTLFRILSTALVPTEGTALLFGADVVKEPNTARRKIGVVFQNPSLDKKLTLQENLGYQGHLYGLSGSTLKERVSDVLARLSLSPRANDLVETLSGGLQRRAEIAKGLLHKPELLIMDEPSTGLDPGARHEMWDYLCELKKEGMTILLTTHLMEEGEKCDRLMILHKGQAVASGTPENLKKKIGGDVISIQTKNPDNLAEKIQAKLGGAPVVVDGTVRMEIQEGHKFIPSLVESFPGMIEAIHLGKPTLEDVFVRETGRKYSLDEVGR